MKKTVSLCMIVRNEEANLPDCLSSVAGLFDEIIVLDTGSTDRTREIALEFGAKVFDFFWVDDFAAARNASRSHATGDWIFWLDADDRVDAVNRERLAKLLDQLGNEPDAMPWLMSCQMLMPASEGGSSLISHVRLFPNRPEIKWVGRVHESLMLGEGSQTLSVRWSEVVIQHHGYLDAKHMWRKQQRDLRLLQMEYAVNPDNPTTSFYLGRAYQMMGRSVEAARLLSRALQNEPGPNESWRPKAHALLAESLRWAGRRDEAIAACEAGLARYPDDPELLYYGSLLYVDAGRIVSAINCLQRLVNAPDRHELYWGVHEDLKDEKARLALAQLYLHSHQAPEAEAQYRQLLAVRPACAEAWVQLGMLYIDHRHPEAVPQVLDGLRRCPRGEVLAKVLEAKLLLAEGRYREGQRLVKDALAIEPQLVWGWLTLSDLLFHEGRDWAACIQAHERILELHPANEGAKKRLEHILAQRAAESKPVRAAVHSGVMEVAHRFVAACV